MSWSKQSNTMQSCIAQQHGGNPTLVQDLYKLAIPFGMLFAQQGIRSAMQQPSTRPPPSKKRYVKSAKSVKSGSQKGGECGCNRAKIPYAAIGGSLQSALDSYLGAEGTEKHV